MQQTNGVAVLATHLAHTDRRALSQAWYSALHLADHGPPPRRAATTSATLARAHAAAPGARTARGAECDAAENGMRGRRNPGARSADGAHERGARAEHARGERGTERSGRFVAGAAHSSDDRASAQDGSGNGAAGLDDRTVLARRTPSAGAASFTVQAAGGRVHLVVRSDGGRTRIVAVCAPPLRERVERALAHVRFVLAGSGVRAEAAS
jgi:hypothetical protein